MSLHVDGDGRIGPYAARSHTVVPVDDLPLATSAVERAALRLGQGRPGRIDLVQPADGRVRILPRADSARTGPAEAREVVTERVGAREFRVDAGGFWQVHRLAAATLDGAVRSAVRELAAGAPTAWRSTPTRGISTSTAASGSSPRRSPNSAARGSPRWNPTPGRPSTRVRTSPSGSAPAPRPRASTGSSRASPPRRPARERDRLARGVTVLDPPRSGAGRDVVEAVATLQPSAVVYVACDPVALARDVATFLAAGYELRQVSAFDLFPNSHHIEAVATFVR